MAHRAGSYVITIIKNCDSSFDATALLVSLCTRLITHIYLAGSLSNMSIYATAADAVRRGFEVTVIEDCLGYQSEARHLEAMKKMADILSVSGIDSDEILEQSGGRMPRDDDLSSSIGREAGAQAPQNPSVTEQRKYPESCASPTEIAMEGVQKPVPTLILDPSDRVGEDNSQMVHRAASNISARTAQANQLLFLWQPLRCTPFVDGTHAKHQVRRLFALPGDVQLTRNASLPSSFCISCSMAAFTSWLGATPNVLTMRRTLLALTSFSNCGNDGEGKGGGISSFSIPEEFRPIKAFEKELEMWEQYAKEAVYVGGVVFTIVDCAFWPVLNEVVRNWEGWSERRFLSLANYWRKVAAVREGGAMGGKPCCSHIPRIDHDLELWFL